MKSLKDYEKEITELYDDFIKSEGIDPSTGEVNGINQRFSGTPFIGSLYPGCQKKVMFVGLDIGSDEGFHDFESRRKAISHDAKGRTMIPSKNPFNAHMAGTYAMAFALLHDTIDREECWNLFSQNNSETAYHAIKRCHKVIPVEMLDYVCLTNAHKFVKVDRKNKGGGQDRVWDKVVKKEKEVALLSREIAILQPDVIVFQSYTLKSIIQLLNINDNVEIITMYHPASRDRYHKSLGYIKEKTNEKAK